MNESLDNNGREKFNLSTEEQEAIKKNIVSFMAARPIQSVDATSVEETGAIPSPWYSPAKFYSWIYMRQITTVALVAVVLFGGGGISIAAERSIPGDVLYPFKTQVNEKLSGYLALTEKSKAKLETELATRRLSEAEELAVKGKLDTDTSKKLETKFKKHVAAVEVNLDALATSENSDDASKLKASFNSNLNAHKNVISELATNDSDVAAWFNVVESASLEEEDTQVASSEESEKKLAIEQRFVANKQLNKLQDLIKKTNEDSIDDSLEKLMVEAQKEFEAKKFKASADHFAQVAKEAEELYVEVSTRISLGLTIPISAEGEATSTVETTEATTTEEKKNKEDKKEETSHNNKIDAVTTEVQSKTQIKLDL